MQGRQPISDRRICNRSGGRRHCRRDVRIFFGGLRAAQRLGLHVEGSGAIAGHLRRLRHRVDGDVDAAATATAEACDRARGFGTPCGPLLLHSGMGNVIFRTGQLGLCLPQRSRLRLIGNLGSMTAVRERVSNDGPELAMATIPRREVAPLEPSRDVPAGLFPARGRTPMTRASWI